jgi:two-component system chemotaxis sensor kinase CheA
VIVESEGKKLGIPVDELLGQQQIVIKSLGESFKNIAGLTGGAILSDGNVGMILDVDGLMKSLHLEEVRT